MKMRRVVRFAAVAIAGAGLVALGTATTQALDPDFLNCFGLMIVDPTAHGTECIVDPPALGLGSLSSLGGANPPPLTTTTTTTYTYTVTGS